MQWSFFFLICAQSLCRGQNTKFDRVQDGTSRLETGCGLMATPLATKAGDFFKIPSHVKSVADRPLSSPVRPSIFMLCDWGLFCLAALHYSHVIGWLDIWSLYIYR